MMEFIKAAVPSVLTILMAAPLLYAFYMKRRGKLTDSLMCCAVIASGFVMRLIYIYYTNDYTRQHDLGNFSEPNNGHAGYILRILNDHALPETVRQEYSQYYHPPLHHIICAGVLAVMRAFGGDIETHGGAVLQLLTVVYSTLFCVFSAGVMRRLGIKGKPLAIALACVPFHPTLIILSGSLNNDDLSSMFSAAAVYFTLRWYDSIKISDIICIAFAVGLGMMTKLTVGLLAPAIAAVFLAVLISGIKNSDWKKLVPQFIVFAVICLPLGLWWTIRLYVKFDMPLGFVPDLGEESGQFIAMSPLRRLFDFSLYQLSSPFTQWEWSGAAYNEFNPVIALLKNAMFDEETFFAGSITLQSFCTLLFFAGAVTAVLSVYAIIKMWLGKEKISLEKRLLITLTFATVFVNYITFCLNYPQVCTENMRYCTPLILSGSAALGLLLGDEKAKALRKTASASMISMAALSAFVYTSMMFYQLPGGW